MNSSVTGRLNSARVVPGRKTVLLGNGNAPMGNNRKSRRTSGVITNAARSRAALTHPLNVFILFATESSLLTPDSEVSLKSAPEELND